MLKYISNHFLPLEVAVLVQVSDWPSGNSEFAVVGMDLQLVVSIM